MKNIRKFETRTQRDAWLTSDEYVFPNVVLTEGVVEYNLENPAAYPLHIEAIEDLTIKFGNTYEYSKDNSTWSSGTSSTSISANAGEKVYYRATGLSATSSAGIGKFTISGKCNIGGNIMSLLYGDDCVDQLSITQNYAFNSLFQYAPVISAKNLILPATTISESCYRNMLRECTSLVDAPELPATTLKKYCYAFMFYGCTSLVNAPDLPATTLADNCYYKLFNDCTSLVNAPELPAITLIKNCYANMFYGCTSLVNAPDLPATTLANSCYEHMFYGCTSLVNAPDLPATTLANSCYEHMFNGCTSLVNAPDLPATTLANSCYYWMFKGCTSLVNAPTILATTIGFYSCGYMFSECTSLVNAPDLPATTLGEGCYSRMFNSCTSLVNAPELPAITLIKGCYDYMFNGCTSLKYIKAMCKTAPNDTYTKSWVENVAASGTFVKNSAATWNVTGVNGIPEGWTVETADA